MRSLSRICYLAIVVETSRKTCIQYEKKATIAVRFLTYVCKRVSDAFWHLYPNPWRRHINAWETEETGDFHNGKVVLVVKSDVIILIMDIKAARSFPFIV